MAHEAHADAVHAHWDTSIWPFVISFGILGLGVAFTFQFVYHSSFAAIIALGLGLPLILGGIAGWTSEAMGKGEGLSFASMGWFILAEAMIFLSCFAAYWAARLNAPDWPPAGSIELPKLIPVIMTITLVSSSLTIHKAEQYLHAGNRSGFVNWLLLTIVLGLAFLGMSGFEWAHLIGEGFTIKTNIFGTVFYSVTGLHGSHVLVGLAIFIAGLFPAIKGNLSPGFWRTAGLYWHFVDIIWFFVVSQVYFW
ncbi:MAG: heme-copper oxidase subunit III [Rhodocyclales bacterium]|nr:heme-copper oxidase subunit III [Rhodocyclales bacterium]